MNKGFITLHRKLLEWEWYTDINVKVLFIHMLLRANHKDKTYRGTTIKRGSFTSSLQVLSGETGLSVQQIRTAINKLEKTNELTHKTTSKFSMYTVVNYDFYQSEQQASNTQFNKQVTSEQQASNTQFNKQVTTNNNVNKENNVNNVNNVNNITSQRATAKESFAVMKFNEVFGTNYKQITDEFESVAHLYSELEIITAINNAFVDDFWQDKATPLNIFKPNNLEKLINQKPKITTANKMLAEQDIEW